MSPKIAYFISPHGYGHAARASAVMTALKMRKPSLHFEIFTKVSPVFFEQSLGPGFGYHTLLSDIGLVQKNSLVEDMAATADALAEFLPFEADLVEALAGQVQRLGCQLILCDIAPLGIAVAQAAGIPSVLIENFTWDWIYEGYLAEAPRLKVHLLYLQEMFAAADYHIQTAPICAPQAVDLTTLPVSRKPRRSATQIRRQLEVPAEARLVMMTMGGNDAWNYPLLDRLERLSDLYFVIANNSHTQAKRANLFILPRHSDFFHPDLVNAADVLIGKVGYSTLAEVYQAGVPFGYLIRPKFRESGPLKAFINANMSGLEITIAEFNSGRWLYRLPELLALPRRQLDEINGADKIATFIDGILGLDNNQKEENYDLT